MLQSWQITQYVKYLSAVFFIQLYGISSNLFTVAGRGAELDDAKAEALFGEALCL